MKIDVWDILNHVDEMSPEECKAMITDFAYGVKLANEFVDDAIELEKLRSSKIYKEKAFETDRSLPHNAYCSIRKARTRSSRDYERVRLEFYKKHVAEETISELEDILDSCGTVLVYNLYSLANLPTNVEMKNWCWDDLSDVSITEMCDGLTIVTMPKAICMVSNRV